MYANDSMVSNVSTAIDCRGFLRSNNIPEKNSHIVVVNILYAIIKPIVHIVISPVYFNSLSIIYMFNYLLVGRSDTLVVLNTSI